MRHSTRFAFALALVLGLAAPALAELPGNNGSVVLESAHSDIDEGLLILRGRFGLQSRVGDGHGANLRDGVVSALRGPLWLRSARTR